MRARTLLQSALAAVVLLALVAGIVGCGSEPGLRERYVAERLAWRAAKTVNAMRANPEIATDEMKAEIADVYREIAERFPPPTDVDSLSKAQMDVAAIAAQSRMRLAALAFEAGNTEEALLQYETVRDGYAYNRTFAVEASIAMAEALELDGRWDDAVATYDRLVTDWPPATGADELPDARILRSPVRVAMGHAARGDEANAAAWFERARQYYVEWTSKWPGSMTAELAMSFRAETFLIEERWSDAAAAYEQLDRDYGNVGNRASIWLTLGETYGKRLGRESVARGYYERVLESYPNDIASATAALELASRDMELGRHEAARTMLEDIVERFPHEEAIRATALQYLALSYEASGMWEDAVAQFNVLAREHPTTLYGLMALQHVAEGFERLGESEAAASALERAGDHYERVVRDYSSTPAELAARGYLIDTRIRQERWEDATRLLTETAERFPESESAASMLMQAAEIRMDELGDRDGATSVLRRVIGSFPDSEASVEAQRRLDGLGE